MDGPIHTSDGGYPQNKKQAAEVAINEAWNWLRVHGLLVPDAGINGTNGYMRLSSRASALTDKKDFDSYKRAAAFPKSLLHPSIADTVSLDLARGELDTAVIKAFKAVEVAVRQSCKFPDADFGIPLMRKAFDKNTGPLSDKSCVDSEREALAHLFAGAIGLYKNPQSHRTVGITDQAEAQEMVMLASHLLRIVDSRRY